MKGKWTLSVPNAAPSIQSVLPDDDVIEHEWGMGCPCDPVKHEQFVPGRGVVAVQIAHNAADGRE